VPIASGVVSRFRRFCRPSEAATAASSRRQNSAGRAPALLEPDGLRPLTGAGARRGATLPP
jgi:hypothetical protein